MSRVPVFQSESEAITYHVDLYYEAIGEAPEVRGDIDKHIALIEQINERYIKALTHRHSGEEDSGFDFELYEPSFKECVEFLTGVYAKRDKREELTAEKTAFRERNAPKAKIY